MLLNVVKRSCIPGFQVNQCGLHISHLHPFLAATPDSKIICKCHGVSIVEVKCPYTHRFDTIEESIEKDKSFCLQKILQNNQEHLQLKTTHPYFYQIQLQLLVCDSNRCLFGVYTTKDFVCIPVLRNESFITQYMVPKCQVFIREIILPELLSKYWTVTRFRNDTNNAVVEIDLEICNATSPCQPIVIFEIDKENRKQQTSTLYPCICDGKKVK